LKPKSYVRGRSCKKQEQGWGNEKERDFITRGARRIGTIYKEEVNIGK